MSLTAIMSAFEPEWATLRALVADPCEEVIAGTRYVAGRIGERRVLLFLSGMSMVNAAMTAERACQRFAPDRLLFTGVAGALDRALDIGDVVVPERWAQPLECTFAKETPTGFAPPRDGLLACPPDLPGFGAIFTREVQVHEGFRRWFDADAALLAVARAAANALSLDADGRTHAIHIGGAGVSSPAFIDNDAYRHHLFSGLGARVADMESAAVAQVAYAHGLPFLAFRSVSDLAGADADENQWERFAHTAACNSAALVTALLGLLP